jgi:hypothetical protein
MKKNVQINKRASGRSEPAVRLRPAVVARHLRANWGITACGRDGWNGHPWSNWEQPDSIKSTTNRRLATCKVCLKAKRQNVKLKDGQQ